MFRLRVLGGFALVDAAGAVVPLAQRRAEAILAILAVSGDLGCTRERLMALVWPDGDEPRSRHVLRDVLYVTRRSLGKDAVISRADSLYLDPAVVCSDVHVFTKSLATGALPEAVGAYSGSLLDGFHVDGAPDLERWLDGERARLGRQYEEALERLASQAEGAERWNDAVLWWRRLVEHDRSNSRLVLRCAQAMYATGDRVNALTALGAHVRWMREEMELEPVPEVVQEMERIRRRGEPDADARHQPARTPARQGGGAQRPPVTGGSEAAREPEERAPAGSGPVTSARRWLRWSMWAAPVVVAVAAAAVLLIHRKRAVPDLPIPRTAVAVVPFQSLSTDSAHAFLARGLHDEVLSQLATVPTLRVVGPSSVVGAQDSAGSLRRIGRELGVERVVQGTVQAAAARLRIIIRLVDPATQAQLWSREYDRTDGDALAAERDVARQVAADLVARFGFITIDVPGATTTAVAGINNVGQVVGTYGTPEGWDHAFVYDGRTFTRLDYPGTGPSAYHYWGGTLANSLNDSGFVVGGHGKTSILPTGYTYRAGTYAAMPVQACALATEAKGVSNIGIIVGASELRQSSCYPYPTPIAFPPLAYLYMKGGFTPLAPPGSIASVARAVNNHGWVVGTYSNRPRVEHGFKFALGHFTTIDVPGCAGTEATGANDSWQLVGICTLSDGRHRGFLLSDGVFTMIDVPGSTSTSVNGMNNAGWIVGHYLDAAGKQHGFEKAP